MDHAAIPWDRQMHLVARVDLKLMGSIVVELQESVVRGSVAAKKKSCRLNCGFGGGF